MRKKGGLIMNTKKKILVVEDEKNIASLLAFNLTQAGFDYENAYDGQYALERALSGEFDLILLDIMLPKMDGFAVLREVRKVSNVPVIMVTAREEEKDKILGLDIGADDYITKPFSINEVLSRIRANIRRYSNELIGGDDAPRSTDENIVTLRDLSINRDRYSATVNGAELELSKKEYDLLLFLTENRGKPFSREELLEKVWGYSGFYGDINTVDVTVSRLRKKLETDPANPEYLMTKRGVGYYIQ